MAVKEGVIETFETRSLLNGRSLVALLKNVLLIRGKERKTMVLLCLAELCEIPSLFRILVLSESLQ